MTTKHTPGPYSQDCEHIDGITKAKMEVAAPDMLAALKGLLADIEEYQKINNLGGENNHWQVRARAALGGE